MADFNSIKVRLKHTLEEFQHYWIKFQFHKGTIKTEIENNVTSGSIVFQFHKGTIKTIKSSM